jgi:hypothetical protein
MRSRRNPSFAAIAALVLTLSALGLPSNGASAEPDGPDRVLPEGSFLSAMTGGNTVGAAIREEEPRADGYRHIDTPAMIKRLEQMHATTYTFGIWEMPTDWDDLRLEFAPAAAAAGIDIMVYVVPPSECFLNDQRHLDGRCSRPFNMDYVAWSQAIARLSVTYPNVKSWAIDDFLVGSNSELFTPEYLRQVRDAQEAINPDLKWYVTLYYYDINADNLAKLDGVLDGVIYAYNGYNNNTIDPTWLEPRLDGALDTMAPYDLDLVLLVYNGRFLDGIIHPDERYAAEMLRRAEPYVADGRITGVIAYAAPVRLDLQQPSWDYWGRSGNGSLSLSVGNFTSTTTGSYAAASETIQVDPNAPTRWLTFYHRDQYGPPNDLEGYQFAQVLVDDDIVWDQDTSTDPKETWIKSKVDLTEALAGKSQATLTFRLFHKNGIGWWPLDLRIDDVSGGGVDVSNGGFENTTAWRLDRNAPTMQPYVDIYHPDRPTRVFNAIGAGYARYQGEEFTPVEGGSWPNLRVSPANRAMYGNGRLEFTVPAETTVPAHTCASASQEMAVDPSSLRYEINFWHADPYQAKFGKYFKQVRIDGEVLWNRDVGDYWPWFYIQGSDHQGVIDVTDFVQGKKSVHFEFRLCTLDDPVSNLDIHYGVDAFETIGLRAVNGGFEADDGWDLQPSKEISVDIDVHGPPVAFR